MFASQARGRGFKSHPVHIFMRHNYNGMHNNFTNQYKWLISKNTQILYSELFFLFELDSIVRMTIYSRTIRPSLQKNKIDHNFSNAIYTNMIMHNLRDK